MNYKQDQKIEQDFRDFEKGRLVEDGVEFWYATKLQKLLGYSKWSEFDGLIQKVILIIQNNEINRFDHILEISKTEKYKFTRYACYLIAINADGLKEKVFFAQQYFIEETRKLEKIKERYLKHDRILAKEKATESEDFLESQIYSRGITDSRHFGRLKSSIDKALLGQSTNDIKKELGIPMNRALTDFTSDIVIQAKSTVNILTGTNVKRKNLYGLSPILKEGKDRAKDTREFFSQQLNAPLESFLSNEGDIKKIEKDFHKISPEVLEGFKQQVKEMELKENKELSPNKIILRKVFFELIQRIALVIMDHRENGELLTREFIDTLPKYINIPEYYNTKNERKNEPHYYQIVRNIKSNKKHTTNIIYQGYAEEIKGGFRITKLGKKYIKDLLKKNQ